MVESVQLGGPGVRASRSDGSDDGGVTGREMRHISTCTSKVSMSSYFAVCAPVVVLIPIHLVLFQHLVN